MIHITLSTSQGENPWLHGSVDRIVDCGLLLIGITGCASSGSCPSGQRLNHLFVAADLVHHYLLKDRSL